ncbi:MAG: carbamoyltransferase HypF [Anaerolineales bacterium]|nr:carbamoyltransferase HypF [Anaerolineales bacterium]
MTKQESGGAAIHITGVVQGVGFRPFVYGLARRLGLLGWVRNTSSGVHIEVDGFREQLDVFVKALREEAPPLSRIIDLRVSNQSPKGFKTFEIIHSESLEGGFQPVSPDVSICPDCLREMNDPNDRRYHYPFINCTNCGPRFTIIKDIPYDRSKTTMADFEMCEDCAREYSDPADRRFHAQPVACPLCGPQIWLETTQDTQPSPVSDGDKVLLRAQLLFKQGKIIAIKGLGGFHLACDAANPQAVARLRERKLRVDKPFALMMPDIETIRQYCQVDDAEQALLQSVAHPIVLLKRRAGSSIASEVAPGQDNLGVMLPYTPLHHLLFSENEARLVALVMTSGNVSEEPIATRNEEARERLAELADAFLMHDRDIHVRCDDSVMRVVSTGKRQALYPLRRSRGYAPFPVKLPWKTAPLLATGAELKNTFCITHGDYAFLSHHIGDMENYETLQSFEQGIEHYQRLFRVKPEMVAYDLHPDYMASRYAFRRVERDGIESIGVQHHHAHIAACMAENGLDGSEPVIGLACDGTGYGIDGAIWGGEVMLADYAAFRRKAHLDYFMLPGGDAAIKSPARIALALLWQMELDWDEKLAPVKHYSKEDRAVLIGQMIHQINTPQTSSMGRLFDAAAALAGVRQAVNYEAQAAIEFEALADPSEEKCYPFELEQGKADIVIGHRVAFQALITDIHLGISLPVISARFHNGLAEVLREVSNLLREESGISKVVLSGGVWQNITLLGRTMSLLQGDGFTVYIHHEVPANDGGLALGQAAIAAYRLIG